jgi:hypothetical protein
MGFPEVYSRKQLLKLSNINLLNLGLIHGPGESILFKAFLKKPKTVPVPISPLQQTPTLVAE